MSDARYFRGNSVLHLFIYLWFSNSAATKPECISPNVRIIYDDEMETVRKKSTFAYLKVLSRQLPQWTEESHEEHQSW